MTEITLPLKKPVGRPPIPTKCPVCQREMGRAELRLHLPKCEVDK